MFHFNSNGRFGRSLLLAALVAEFKRHRVPQLSQASAQPIRKSPMPVRRWTSSQWA